MQGVLCGYLKKTSIIKLLAEAEDDEALVKIQQMQGVVAKDLSHEDVRSVTPGQPAANNNQQTTATSAPVPVRREIYARVGSAVYGCASSRTARALVKPVLTVKAQVREMYVHDPSCWA